MILDSDIVIINQRICEYNNQTSTVINPDNLLSAVGNIQWYDKIEYQAASLMRSLIIGNPFQDANKRTAVIACAFICPPTCSDIDLENCAINIATGKLKEVADIADVLYPELNHETKDI